MATWSGWAAQFLSAASLPNTPGNLRWLDDWSTNSISDCRNNPVDVSRVQGNSTNCKRLTSSRTAQNYTSHAQAATAFNHQLHSGNFPHLLAAMQSGDYPSPSKLGDILIELQRWGSLNFVAWLEKTFGIAPGGGGIGSGPTAPHALKGWNDLRKTVNRGLPSMLRTVGKLNAETSRSLGRRRRVRH